MKETRKKDKITRNEADKRNDTAEGGRFSADGLVPSVHQSDGAANNAARPPTDLVYFHEPARNL